MHTLMKSMPVALLLILPCSTALGAEPAPAACSPCPPDLSGRWSGCWESECTGHHGPLHARFCKVDDCHYRVRFHGRFFKIIPFMYSVTLNVTGYEGDKVLLSGESYLGRLMGTFYYCADADCCHFTATYTSCKDKGTFRLERKKGCCD